MADEREVTIVLRGKNLTKAEFDAARKELAGVSSEADKAKATAAALGQAFKALAPALTVGALTAYAGKILDTAGQISDLAAQTGLSTRAIQEMQHAAKMTGASLESFTNAAFKLGTNLSGGSSSVRAAVDALGLSYTELSRLSPDEQFNTVARALQGVEREQDRNRLAIELFGKTAKEILPAIATGYDDLAAAASVAGDDQIAALDMAGDALDSFWESVTRVSVDLAGGLVISLREAWRLFGDLTKIDEATAALRDFGTALQVIGLRDGPELPKVLNAARVAAGNLPKPLGDVSVTMEKADRISQELTKSIEKKNQALDDSAKAYAKDLEESQVWGGGLSDTDHLLADLGITMGQYETAAYSAADATADLWQQFYRLRGEAQAVGPVLRSTLNLGAMFAPLKAGLRDTGSAVQSLGGTIKESLGGVIASVPGTLARAFEGGGNWLGAAKSIGSQFGSAIGASIGSTFTALGTLGGPIGSAIGSLVGPLIGKIAGLFTSKNTQEVKAYNVEIGKVRDALLATYGPLDQLEAKAQAVGLSFRENWGHQGKAGLEAMKTLAEEFKRRWDDLNDTLAASNSELAALIARGADLGYEFDQAGNLVRVNFEKMQEAAQKYGVDLGSLGPAFQGQRLHASAEQIINDFTLLTKGGADVGAVLVGMKDEISALVVDSIKFGTDIPKNMQPWIEELLRSGQLTDENGQKITDLTGIRFGEPIATEFAKITTKLEEVIGKISELVDRLSGTLAPAVDAVTRDRTIHIGFNVDDVPVIDIDAKGHERESRGFARGTFGALGVDFPDFGDGTRAILHHREAVVPYEAREETARRWLGQAGVAASAMVVPAPNVYIVGDTSREARVVSEAEFRQIQDRLNGGGLTVPVRAISQRGR